MSKQSVREIFDTISLNVIGFLENHIGITDIDFVERSGVAEMSISKWEEENLPYQLPDDLKAFLQISDGLSLTWKLRKCDQNIPLGNIHLNKLRDIKRLKGEYIKLSRIGLPDEDEDSDENVDDSANQKDSQIVGFEIDQEILNGRVALLYMRGQYQKPQIWFQDLSCSWFYISNCFTDYFRLMIMHLGIPNWQYAFTKVGLDPQTMQWLRFFVPERLAIDMESRRNLDTLNKKSNQAVKPNSIFKFANDKIKVEGNRRKRRRMRLRAKNGNEAAIEKFAAQSCKTTKYAKTIVKKREVSELRQKSANQDSNTLMSGGFDQKLVTE